MHAPGTHMRPLLLTFHNKRNLFTKAAAHDVAYAPIMSLTFRALTHGRAFHAIVHGYVSIQTASSDLSTTEKKQYSPVARPHILTKACMVC